MFITYHRKLTPLFHGSQHRWGVWDCPNCGYGTYNDYAFWDLPENIHQIILDSPMNKMDGIIVLSECPHCHQISWCHRDLDFFEEWTDKKSMFYKPEMAGISHTRLAGEIKRRTDINIKKWDESQCKDCKNIWELECWKYFVSIHCGGYGWTRCGCPDSNCERYIKGNPHTLPERGKKIDYREKSE